jgi:hypothetical protein
MVRMATLEGDVTFLKFVLIVNFRFFFFVYSIALPALFQLFLSCL